MLDRGRAAAFILALFSSVPAQPGYATTPDDEPLIEEVIVTARQREEDIQQVPISVLAFDELEIERRGIDDFENIGLLVPNAVITGEPLNGDVGTRISVRGLPGAAAYIDGVWQANASGLLLTQLVDIERIEVLRGAQGPVYGRNTLGGVVRILTRKPGKELSGKASLTLAELGHRALGASVDVPLADNVRTRWTLSERRRGGYVENVESGTDLGDTRDRYLSGDLLWTPSQKLSLRLQAESYRFALPDGQARILPAILPESLDLNPFELLTGFEAYIIAGFPLSEASHVAGFPGGALGKYDTRMNVNPGGGNDSERLTLTASWRPLDNLSLNLTSSYRTLDGEFVLDLDATEFSIFEVRRFEEVEETSHELQLTGEHGAFSWMLGAYYWDEQRKIDFPFWTYHDLRLNPEGLAAVAAVQPFYAFFVGQFVNFRNLILARTDGIAGYGSFVWNATDRLELSAGIRRHGEDRRDTFFEPATPISSTPGLVRNPLRGQPISVADVDSHFEATTGNVSLVYRWRESLMGYLSYGEGFGTGGTSVFFRSPVPPGSSIVRRFDPDRSKNYELGVKSTWWDWLQLNVAVFHIDWLDVHITEPLIDPLLPSNFNAGFVSNGGEAEMDGFEAELSLSVGENLSLGARLGHLDAKYVDVGNADRINEDAPLELAPEWSYALSADFSTTVAGECTLTLHFGYAWQDEMITGQDLDLAVVEPSYGLWRARATLSTPKDRWKIGLWVNNLANKRYGTGSGQLPPVLLGAVHTTVGRPREFGVDLEIRF